MVVDAVDPWKRQARSAVDAVRRAQAAMAAGNLGAASLWIHRAHRLAPMDSTVQILFASIAIHSNPAKAVAMLDALTRRLPWHREAAMAHSAALLRSGRNDEAARSLGTMLVRMSPPGTDMFAGLADAICAANGLPGWVALDGDGQCRVSLGRVPLCVPWGRASLAGAPRSGDVRFLVDDQPAGSLRLRPGQVAVHRLGEGWQHAHALLATVRGQALLGSGLDPSIFSAVDGFVGAAPDGAIAGWARLSCGSEAAPSLYLCIPGNPPHRIALTPDPDDEAERAEELQGLRWRFHLSQDELQSADSAEVVGLDGRNLWGSPVLLAGERRAAAMAARRLLGPALTPSSKSDLFRPLPVSLLPVPLARFAPRTGRGGKLPCDVVVPVYSGLAELELCLRSLRATLPRSSQLVLVNDGSPDPAISARLMAEAGPRVTVLVHERPRGFPAAVNAGLAHLGRKPGRDVIILNADTVVGPRWIERLSAVAHSDSAIGSCTPLTNDGTLVCYPEPDKPGASLEPAEVEALSELCWDANGSESVPIPTGVGFCMLMKGACLAETGPFRENVFAQGYGEENDWCLRAAHLGWRHVAAPGVFVAHSGGRSFGAAKALLMERNGAVLERLHPGYGAYIEAALAREPLLDARRRIDRLKLLGSPGQPAVALITHNGSGGVARHVTWRCAKIAASGRRPIVLSPRETAGICRLSVWANDNLVKLPNLRFKLPAELPNLAAVLRDAGVTAMEVHHLLEHALCVTDLPAILGVPYSVFVHDYGHWCPRISLTSRGERYCGEPLSQHVCEECIADLGSRYEDNVTVDGLRAHSSRLLAEAERVSVACEDVAARIRRQFPGIQPEIVPWEDEAPDGITPLPRPTRAAGSDVHVVVVGAIGVEKGYDVLLFCARDAARRELPLRFTVVGHTIDDDRLITTGRVFVTGYFEETEGLVLVQDQQATIGFVPSVCPETWCYALSLLWRAGLPVMAFGLGAQGYRIERSGAGWLVPVGISVSKINDALVSRGNAPPHTLSASSRMWNNVEN